MQLLDSEQVELEEIVCDSPFATTLRSLVLEDTAPDARAWDVAST